MKSAQTPTPVRSPCVNVCLMDEGNGLCKGCFRTQDERDWWVAYSPEQQREVIDRCDQRRLVARTGVGEFAPNMGEVVSPKRAAKG